MTAATSQAQLEALIAEGFREQLLVPSDPLYEPRIESWWAADCRLHPACIVQPRTSQDVSRVIKALGRVSNGEFAVRSGGCCLYSSASNIDDGVTIDLGNLNQVTYDEDTKLASLGPGQPWDRVYETLEPMGRMVSGCRCGIVGVAGFLLGGGFSYYVGLRGFSCDDVVNFEVVLADGRIVNANARENQDLWKALKGGAANFGIVTRFDMETFPARNLWGGVRVLDKSYAHDALKAFSDFVADNHKAPEAVSAVNLAYAPQFKVGESVVVQFLADTNGVPNPPSLTGALQLPEIFTNVKTQSMTEIALIPFPAGLWVNDHTMTFKNDPRLFAKGREIFEDFIADCLKVIDPNDLQAEFLLQPLPKLFADIGVQKGGNVLGLDSVDDDCVVWVIMTRLRTREQKDIAYPKVLALKDSLEQCAREMGAFVPWQSMNYSDAAQDPLKSYGPQNLQFLRDVAKKYDPMCFFQSARGFALSKAG